MEAVNFHPQRFEIPQAPYPQAVDKLYIDSLPTQAGEVFVLSHPLEQVIDVLCRSPAEVKSRHLLDVEEAVAVKTQKDALLRQ